MIDPDTLAAVARDVTPVLLILLRRWLERPSASGSPSRPRARANRRRMATDLPPSIPILKPGTFTDIHGKRVTFTRADLDGIVASYDAASDPAPIVIGHPKIDAPAFGWIGSLAMEGDTLMAQPSEVVPAFAEAVTAGHYRKRSPQLYPPTSPSNPKPGSWYLQHVGFLGAAPPAIKGLGTYAFSETADAEAVVVTIDQEQIMSDTPDSTTETIGLAEHTAQTDALQARIDELEAQNAARDQAAAEAAQAARHAENVAFAEGLVAAGYLAPAAREVVVGLQDQLDAVATVSFGEGDQVTPLAAFRKLFDAGHPVIALGEHAGADKLAPEPVEPVALAEQALEFVTTEAAAGRSVTIQQAVRHVERAAATA